MIYKCAGCGEDVDMPDNYKPEYCCEGLGCGCGGKPIEPVLCLECECKVYSVGKHNQEVILEKFNIEKFKKALYNCNIVKVVLTGVGESEFSASEVYKYIEDLELMAGNTLSPLPIEEEDKSVVWSATAYIDDEEDDMVEFYIFADKSQTHDEVLDMAHETMMEKYGRYIELKVEKED